MSVESTFGGPESSGFVAVVPVRAARLALGGLEAAAEAGGNVVLVGDGTIEAAATLIGVATRVRCLEREACQPAVTALLLAEELADERVIVLPASPDGRDLAPRLAHVLGRSAVGGALHVRANGATVARAGGLTDLEVDGPFVVTLQPGVRTVSPDPGRPPVEPAVLRPDTGQATDTVTRWSPDPKLLELREPDPATMDLGDAPRIVGGGVGLGDEETFALLHRLGELLGASVGATRVVTDLGWAPFERQIGTTGVLIDPRLYVAFGVSGAVQHVSGLGQPEHIVSVNLDASCPMTSMADLGVVSDAPGVLRELIARLENA